MELAKLLWLTLAAGFLFIPRMECQPPLPTRPLCISQFVLVNHACAMVPVNPRPVPDPPAPPSPDDDNGNDSKHGRSHEHVHEHRRGQHHHHHHHHRHRHHHHYSPAENNCCRWLREVDTECVCDMLVRLPLFMSRPQHSYTVNVEGDCSVTYNCGGRLRV